MDQKSEIKRSLRKKGQKFALLANMFTPVGTYVMVGVLMIIFAGDVLSLPVSQITRILAIIPIVSLLRFFFMKVLSSIGKVRLIQSTAVLKILIILTLIFIPSEYLSYRVYLILLISFSLISQLGLGTAWQPLLRDITSDSDRGRFFSRMRLVFTIINLIVTGLIPLIIGESISSLEYKFFLILPLISQVNMIFMVNKVPEVKEDKKASDRLSFKEIIADLNKIKRPLLIIALVQCTFFPLFVLYLRQGLNLPSNVVATAVFTGTLGNAFSLLFWGQISDTVGFRNTLLGVHLLSFIQIPFLLLIQPSAGYLISIPLVLGLLFYSFFDGVVMAGSGIAMISVQHFFSSKEKSMFVFSVYAALTLIINAFWILLTGKVIEVGVIPIRLPDLFPSFLYLDGVKLFIILVPLTFRLLLFLTVRTLPNIQPWFGLGDFFISINPASIRTMVRTGRLHKLDNSERERISHSLGHRGNPFSIRSLTTLLKDPSYDVKVTAIRELGRSGSLLAGEKLYPMLKNSKMAIYHEHIVWSLGQLQWEEASEDLLDFLNSDRSEKLKAVAARALGRIGSNDSILRLRELTDEMTPTYHLSSSACWSLIKLDMIESAEYIFKAIPRFHDSNIRYEIMDQLCPYLEISNSWILKYGQDQGAWKALLEYTEEQSERWRSEKSQLISSLKSLDYENIRSMYIDQFPWRENPVSLTFLKILRTQNEWNALFLLAAAQLLLKIKNNRKIKKVSLSQK